MKIKHISLIFVHFKKKTAINVYINVCLHISSLPLFVPFLVLSVSPSASLALLISIGTNVVVDGSDAKIYSFVLQSAVTNKLNIM